MTESETNHIKNLTAALMQASATDPAGTTKPTPAERSKANLVRIHAESGLECPSCGFEGPESEFSEVELDSDSDSYETDSETGSTSGDPEAKLAKRLLKAAGYQPEQSDGEKPKYKQLTREEIQAILSNAVKNLRR